MRTLGLVALLLLATPSASAGFGALSLTTAEDVGLAGEASVLAPGGQLRAVAWEGDAQGGVLRNVTGTLTVWTWTRAAVVVPDVAFAQERVDPARADPYALEDATLRWSPTEAPATLVVLAREGGVLEAQGLVDAAGRPARVPWSDRVLKLPERAGAPESVATAWREGWPFVGTFAAGKPWVGFPLAAGARASMSGPVDLSLQGGVLQFEDADGRTVAVRLDPRREASAGPNATVERWARAVFRGEVGGAELPMPAEWGLAAPGMEVSFTGAARWTHATGAFATGGERRAFDHATVEGRGALRVAAVPAPGAGEPGRLQYRAEGEWEEVWIGGVAVAERGPGVPAAVATGAWAGAVLLAALGALEVSRGVLSRGVAALYVRLGPGELLAHPCRARIHEAVRANPGIHLRRLHRLVEGAWGTFNFHVHMLVQGGHLRLRREGGFTLVFASGDVQDPPRAIPHPTAREIHALLPADGTMVGVARLREQVGVSRQLLDHHLRWLRAHGLVELVAPKPGVERLVGRRGGP